jgi:hypothetical protein
MDLLVRSSFHGRWMQFFLAFAVVASGATLGRVRLLAIPTGLGALAFLLLVRGTVRADFVRSFGEDSLGRFTESEATSTLGFGYFVAVGAVVMILAGAILDAASRSR